MSETDSDGGDGITIEIVWQGGSGIDENVETWWYEETTLFVRYLDGSVEEYPLGDVIRRL